MSRVVPRRFELFWVALIGLMLSACASEAPPAGTPLPVLVEQIGESEIHRISLSAPAATRLDIHTAEVRDEPIGAAVRRVMPYGALMYDEDGNAWAYTNPEPLVFVREAIDVDYVEDELVVLASGPSPGTLVVTVGAAELWGAETGVGGGH